MRFAGRIVQVEVRTGRAGQDATDDSPDAASGEQHATYELLEGPTLETRHHGEPVRLQAGEPVTRDVPPLPVVVPVSQPAGRAPAARTPPGQ
jgi:hypothetical protein